jgi:D-serine deaminase-like pyridoxal phosphate-dependent protein
MKKVTAGMHIAELPTPCLMVDLDKMERNITSWQEEVSSHNCALRPHIKTHKIPDIAKMQIAAGAKGITSAKVSEAEVFAREGINDIYIAYPIVGQDKWQGAAELARENRIIVGADSEIGLRGLSAAAVRAGSTIEIRIEFESGLGRSGAPREKVLELCRLAESLPGLELNGLMTYRSTAFAGAKNRDVEEVGREEGELLIEAGAQMRAAGIEIKELTGGSTPTGKAVAKVPGISEVRPGTYVFNDYICEFWNVADYDDCALSILTTVVSRPSEQTATVDGGSKTFAGDLWPSNFGAQGYARAAGQEAPIEAYVARMSEEHGVVHLADESLDWKIGERVAFHPIHVCTTVNLSDELVGVRNGKVEVVWPVAARGKRT